MAVNTSAVPISTSAIPWIQPEIGVQRTAARNGGAKLTLEKVSVFYGAFCALRDVTMQVRDRRITAIIGPSGCGKSTLLRSLNRMNDTVTGCRVEGKLLLDGADVYARGVDPVAVRRRVGMVFQRPNPFP